ncbi:RNA polymerase sigma factor [Flavobacterium agrisoli]|uniref:Sigma-70 family RNA polymerase sigma factor n=1 Tax=Flavobacterium agrisoli TaxID=2793066 RepID=A0A934PLH0_9FLAO|nr:sigma-70 family RNA polymerase sigma factor [Flavobacterium agrisoli]MBK0370362.1 sigma-70 family RNA polymerase sigma factor [Flavobacterium agrisoli]
MKIIALHQNESEIIRLAIDQDRKAQQQLYSKFSPKMLSVCRQYVKDIQQAEDVMITAFLKVFQNLKAYQNKGSFEGWIRKIMINECISFLRSHKKMQFLEEQFLTEESHNELEVQLSVDQIQFVIDALPDGYKTIFNLFAIEGYKHQEIADLLGISEGTSKSQLSHARKLLQLQISNLKMVNNGTK